MIQIYGSARSSAGRCYLVLEEIGVPYETKTLDMFEKKEHKQSPFLKLNPNGKVPCLVDGDFVIWESIAINSYLAEKYKPELLGSGAQEKGLVQQWSIWAMTELQPPLVEILIQMMFVPEPKRDMNLVAKAKEKIPAMLKVLDQALAGGKRYLVSDKFTLADLNVGSVINLAQGLQIPTDEFTAIKPWFQALKDRPSFQKFSDLRKH
jgi:glutathione S-transferase